MESIKNVEIGDFFIDPMVLCTTGVSSCITSLIELESGIFIYHVDPINFNADASCSMINAYTFLKKIFDVLYQMDPQAILKHIYLLGGYHNINYMQLRNQIDVMHENSKSVLKVNVTLPPDNFDHFVSLIKLNLIGFNTQRKTFEGRNKEEQDDDNPNDFVFDCTVVYDRSSIPATLAVWQYGGREHEMLSNRSDKLLLAIYQVDTISHVVQAYMYPGASKSLFYAELFAQVLRNVTDPLCLHQSLNDQILKKKLDSLLSRVEEKPMFDDDDY
jgi:hypothetical protein